MDIWLLCTAILLSITRFSFHLKFASTKKACVWKNTQANKQS